ncbi:hypothetical protein L2E82_10750 [Cichorium intybus]|uniref:Uncharacterized protein n=1 Tax=Cichorium intybus TaxID=13427 RepID=A0ACB9GCF1_CICIN|nr:hypothetical protein L2E82_10750 [Cichorium intybus]
MSIYLQLRYQSSSFSNLDIYVLEDDHEFETDNSFQIVRDKSGFQSAKHCGFQELRSDKTNPGFPFNLHLVIQVPMYKSNIVMSYPIVNEYLGLKNGILDQSAIFKLWLFNIYGLQGLKQALTTNPGCNRRVYECQEAAKVLLKALGKNVEPILCNVEQEEYEAHKSKLEPDLARRAEHYFSENLQVIKGSNLSII